MLFYEKWNDLLQEVCVVGLGLTSVVLCLSNWL